MSNQQDYTPTHDAQPLVTFIITCYNLPLPMVCECIDSILALSLSASEREIILVDDGSDVCLMNSLMTYGDDILYIRQKNGGVSVARNTGLQMATGRFIQIVDGDDCILQAPYEHCLDIIRYGKETDVVLFDFTNQKQSSHTTCQTSEATTGAEYMRNHNMRGAVWCCLFRNALRGTLQFTPGISYGEDEEFTPQLLLRAEHVYATPAKAYYYRKRESSAVHQKDPVSKQKRLEDTLTVIRHLHTLTDSVPHDERLALQRRVAQLTMDYIYNTIVLTYSRQELDNRLDTLYAEGLFPLPDRDYSQKYKWFRKMTNSSFGRSVLLHTLPLLSKER